MSQGPNTKFIEIEQGQSMKALKITLVVTILSLAPSANAADAGYAGSPDVTRTSGNCNQLQGYVDTDISDGESPGPSGPRSRLCKLRSLGSSCRLYKKRGSSVGKVVSCDNSDRQLGIHQPAGGPPVTFCASSGCRVNDNQNSGESAGRARGPAR